MQGVRKTPGYSSLSIENKGEAIHRVLNTRGAAAFQEKPASKALEGPGLDPGSAINADHSSNQLKVVSRYFGLHSEEFSTNKIRAIPAPVPGAARSFRALGGNREYGQGGLLTVEFAT